MMLLVVVYGVYTFFFETPPQETFVSSTKELEDLNAFIFKMAEESRAGLSKEDSYIIERAEAEWKGDPLINADLKAKSQKEIQKEKKVIKVIGPELEISYSGYLQMGDKQFAIIDGVEYEVGDALDQGGFKVQSISPKQVEIVATDDPKKRLIFPLAE